MLNSDTKQNNVYIDLRSDTVTKPTLAMRAKMAEAEVGDDIYKDDPTVNALEARVAQITGKERALFVPSGTMGNQICIKAHTRAGEEIILHRKSHIFVFEAESRSADFRGYDEPCRRRKRLYGLGGHSKRHQRRKRHASGKNVVDLHGKHA